MSQNLSITQTGAVARITLTQPEIRNAFSDEVIAEITAAFIDVGGRADVRAVVQSAAFQQKAQEQGATAEYLSPQQLGEQVRADLGNWAQVVKASHIEAE